MGTPTHIYNTRFAFCTIKTIFYTIQNSIIVTIIYTYHKYICIRCYTTIVFKSCRTGSHTSYVSPVRFRSIIFFCRQYTWFSLIFSSVIKPCWTARCIRCFFRLIPHSFYTQIRTVFCIKVYMVILQTNVDYTDYSILPCITLRESSFTIMDLINTYLTASYIHCPKNRFPHFKSFNIIKAKNLI